MKKAPEPVFIIAVKEMLYPAVYEPTFDFQKERFRVSFERAELPADIADMVCGIGKFANAASVRRPQVDEARGRDEDLAAYFERLNARNIPRDKALIRVPAELFVSLYSWRYTNGQGTREGTSLSLHGVRINVDDLHVAELAVTP